MTLLGFCPLILKEFLQEFAQGDFIKGLPGSVASRGVKPFFAGIPALI